MVEAFPFVSSRMAPSECFLGARNTTDSIGNYGVEDRLYSPANARGQNQNCRGTAPRLFWIIPTYTVTNLRSPAPLTPNEKFHLVLADKTDPFNIGQIAVYAGIV